MKTKNSFLAVVLMLSAALTASAKSEWYGGICYEQYDGSVRAVEYDGKTPDVTIPEQLPESVFGKQMPVESIAFSYSGDAIISFTCKAPVESLHEFSLAGCPNLKEVHFPPSVTSIADSQFCDNPLLDVNSVLTDNIKSIGSNAFSVKEMLKCGELNIPTTDIYIDTDAFAGRLYSSVSCHLKFSKIYPQDLDLSETETLKINSIGNSWAETEFNSYEAGDGSKFPKLRKFIINGLQKVSIYYTPTIENVVIIGEVNEVALNGPFDSALSFNLDNAEMSRGSLYINNCDVTDGRFDAAGKINSLRLEKISNLTDLIGLEGVKELQVKECPMIETLNCPDIEILGSQYFADNAALKEVYLGDKLKEVYSYCTFQGCRNLENVIWGGTLNQWVEINWSLPEAGEESEPMMNRVNNFWYGSGNSKVNKLETLTSDMLPGIDKIPGGPFTGYRGLKSVSLDSRIKTIGGSAFINCKNLTSASIEAERIEQWAFMYTNSLADMTIGKQLKYVGPAFGPLNAWGLKRVTPKVQYQGEASDWNNVTLTTTAYKYANNYNEGTTTITYGGTPNIVSFADEFLFNGNALESLTYDMPEEIDDRYAGCKTIKEIIIKAGPSGTRIKEGAFANCVALTTITYYGNKTRAANSGVTIGNRAFEYCYKLKEIGFIDDIASIEGREFKGSAWEQTLPQGEAVYMDTEKQGKLLYCVTKSDYPSSVAVEEGTGLVLKDAFEYANIKDLTIPSSVVNFGNSYLDGLEKLILSDGVKPIENNGTIRSQKVSAVKSAYIGRQLDNEILEIPVENLIIGDAVKTVGNNFAYTQIQMSITVLSDIPPVCETWYEDDWKAFRNVDFEQVVLYVPETAVDDYKEHSFWGRFKNIRAGSSSVSGVLNDQNISTGTRHFDMQGRSINKDVPGIHIVVDKNGKAHKILIK